MFFLCNYLPDLTVLRQVPSTVYKYKSKKCTVIVASTFSHELQLQIEEGKWLDKHIKTLSSLTAHSCRVSLC